MNVNQVFVWKFVFVSLHFFFFFFFSSLLPERDLSVALVSHSPRLRSRMAEVIPPPPTHTHTILSSSPVQSLLPHTTSFQQVCLCTRRSSGLKNTSETRQSDFTKVFFLFFSSPGNRRGELPCDGCSHSRQHNNETTTRVSKRTRVEASAVRLGLKGAKSKSLKGAKRFPSCK